MSLLRKKTYRSKCSQEEEKDRRNELRTKCHLHGTYSDDIARMVRSTHDRCVNTSPHNSPFTKMLFSILNVSPQLHSNDETISECVAPQGKPLWDLRDKLKRDNVYAAVSKRRRNTKMSHSLSLINGAWPQ